jgi:seryl-tRNA synthetase
VDFDVNVLRKKINEVQKEIATKKKVCSLENIVLDQCIHFILQAKEPADNLVATKKEIDAQVEEKKKEVKEFEIRMRQKASTVGNIVGKNAPVSQTEVSSLSSLEVINPSIINQGR